MFENIREQFDIYKKHPDLVYLDSSATALKPRCVLDKVNSYYTEYGVNVHRGVYELSYIASSEYEKAREKVSEFINCDFSEVVFKRNASEALNFVALTYGEKYLKEGDVVLTTELEHHSSVLPWMKLCERKKAKLEYIKLNDIGRITLEEVKKALNEKVKVLAITYVSNVLGYKTLDLEEIIKEAHKVGAIVIVDASQAVMHFKVDCKKLDCDFLAFSAHKMMGPTGIGVLFGKKEILNKLDPLEYGGDMNDEVCKYSVTVKEIPYRFETGTPAIAEAIGLGRAIDFINQLGLENIEKYTKDLHQYALNCLKNVKGITIYNKESDAPIIAFNIDGVHPHDASTLFDENNICLRAGHHCAQLVTKWLKVNGTLRASIYIYNTKEDIDKFVKVVKENVEFFSRF